MTLAPAGVSNLIGSALELKFSLKKGGFESNTVFGKKSYKDVMIETGVGTALDKRMGKLSKYAEGVQGKQAVNTIYNFSNKGTGKLIK